jgi:hypothetical protein
MSKYVEACLTQKPGVFSLVRPLKVVGNTLHLENKREIACFAITTGLPEATSSLKMKLGSDDSGEIVYHNPADAITAYALVAAIVRDWKDLA